MTGEAPLRGLRDWAGRRQLRPSKSSATRPKPIAIALARHYAELWRSAVDLYRVPFINTSSARGQRTNCTSFAASDHDQPPTTEAKLFCSGRALFTGCSRPMRYHDSPQKCSAIGKPFTNGRDKYEKPERERPGSSPCTVIAAPGCTVAPILPPKSSCLKYSGEHEGQRPSFAAQRRSARMLTRRAGRREAVMKSAGISSGAGISAIETSRATARARTRTAQPQAVVRQRLNVTRFSRRLAPRAI